MNYPVFDLHCDTTFALLGDNYRKSGSLKQNELHIDLEKASVFPAYAQIFACYVDTSLPIAPVDLFEREIATFHREVDKNQDVIRQAFSAKDIIKNAENGLMSAILAIEGPGGFDYDPELLDDLFKIGFRTTTLCWNENNPLTGSHLTGGGLTDLGREYVKEAQRLGMRIDVSHISDKGFWDIMDMTQAPVIATHSNSRTICDHSRNLTDDMFREICNTGGVAGINLFADFVSETPTLDAVCDHIFHFISMDPDCKHIAIGGDLDGCDSLVIGINSINDYSLIADALNSRGLSDDLIMNIFWKNALGVIC